ncbi:hypothetical protein AMTRI_Chr13g89090 [Amborella trichopoda]
MHIILILQSGPLAKNFKGKSFEYWKEQNIIVGNDFAEGGGARMTTQPERDIDDDIEDVRETIIGLDDDDGVKEIGDMKTSLRHCYVIKEGKKTMVDPMESIGVAMKEIGAAIVELRKPAGNTHIREVYRALKQVHGLARPVFMPAYNEMMADVNISEGFLEMTEEDRVF